jgi:hypothetical protein
MQSLENKIDDRCGILNYQWDIQNDIINIQAGWLYAVLAGQNSGIRQGGH